MRVMDYYYLPTLEGRKAEWLTRGGSVYRHSGHLSTVDQAKIGESPPAKDRRPNR